MNTNSAILLLTYNRPSLLKELLSHLPTDRQYILLSDGPRYPEHADNVIECRKLLKRFEDSLGSLGARKIFRDNNLGGPIGIPQAITTVARDYEIVHVIEDDIIPSLGYFDFAEWALSAYANASFISGCLPFDRLQLPLGATHVKSKLLTPWCWSLRSSSWNNNVSLRMADFSPDYCTKLLSNIFNSPKHVTYWLKKFKQQDYDRTNWDYRLIYDAFQKKLLTVYPSQNMATNVGIGAGNMHFHNSNHRHGRRINTSQVIPKFVPWNEVPDVTSILQSKLYHPHLLTKVKNKLSNILRNYI